MRKKLCFVKIKETSFEYKICPILILQKQKGETKT